MSGISPVLPVIPLKNTLVFPQLAAPLSVGRLSSLSAIRKATDSRMQLITVSQRDAKMENPGIKDLYTVGTLVNIKRVERRDDSAQLLVEGVNRVKILTASITEPFLGVTYEILADLSLDSAGQGESDKEIIAFMKENLDLAEQISVMYDPENGKQIFSQLIGSIDDPVIQMYRIASLANLELTQEQQVLEYTSAIELFKYVHKLLEHEIGVTRLRKEISEQTRTDIGAQQREHLLRQQKRAIESALGEKEDSEQDDITELKELLAKAKLPDTAKKEVDRELKRLARMSANASDYQVSRSYLELVAELPWSEQTTNTLSLQNAKDVLDEDHFGLTEVKDRILENLAVMQLNPAAKAPILCLVGPPGVGKTSLGKSIARAMGRKFDRLSLGGLHDEAELRGHRRTYIGAMPGRIIQGIRRTSVNNPVLMLDEIDKLGNDFRGDPAAALMEILDPAQNKEFMDNYLNLPFDLSNVFFITTANSLDTIARPLLDRMEILDLSGYSDIEKLEIASRYLVPRQRVDAGLSEKQLNLPERTLLDIIHHYTREAGVRQLERVISRVARKRARAILEAQTAKGPRPRKLSMPILPKHLPEFLGPQIYYPEKSRKKLPPGVAQGLAWTEAGGVLLHIEATLVQKSENIILTGQLGSVMQESAKAARSYIWSAAEKLHIDRKKIENSGVHIHIPAGAVPKDGPSAGITMACALASAYSGRTLQSSIAMTGELTLSGLVLPVGGVKEKIMAAHRAGIKHIIIPKANQNELKKLPDTVLGEIKVDLVERFEEVSELAFN
ncbi:MAG: endopeptidase La [Pseudomonadales bacterium]|nr:endopeptidase La [Pseudomonadales bacterium]